MSHSLIPSPCSPTPISTRPSKKTPTPTLIVSQPQKLYITCSHAPDHHVATGERLCNQSRRMFVWGLTGAMLGLNVANQDANAAKRKPPPPSPSLPEERKDPNVSGVQAKVLASMKRKEAMKEAMAKLREKGKPITEETKE